jgi:hypothetical protein
LDRHQATSAAAMSSLQGELSKITSLMTNMQMSFARFHPPESTTTADPPPTQQAPTFHTPPNRSSQPLSPIPEESTPLSSTTPHPR